MTLNLKTRAGQAVFHDLVRAADVVVENYAAGTADRLGVGYEAARAANPAVVYASISGFGQSSGSDGTDKAMDSIVQALSGVMMTAGDPGDPPIRFGLPIGDLLAPLFCVVGVLAALMQADRTGQGQHVDVSMLGALTSLVACEPFDALELLGLPMRTGQTVPRLAPFGMFEASDGWIALCAPTDEFARALFKGMGRADLSSDGRFERRDGRARHADELHALIGDWVRARSREDVVSALSAEGVPVAAVRTPGEAVLDRRVRDRGEVVRLIHPDLGETDFMGPGIPIRFSATTVALDQPAPHLGEHTAEILGETLGYSAERIAMLAEAGVI
jgi:CoA:oxalate CoA-transferase